MNQHELQAIGAQWEISVGLQITMALAEFGNLATIYTADKNNVPGSKTVISNPTLSDALRIKNNNILNRKGSLPDLDFVIAIGNVPIDIISAKGSPDDAKGYAGNWHSNEYNLRVVQEYTNRKRISFRTITKDIKGTYSNKKGVTKYFDMLHDTDRIYIDYSVIGYDSTIMAKYADQLGRYTVNPALAPIVQPISQLSVDIRNNVESYMKQNHPEIWKEKFATKSLSKMSGRSRQDFLVY